MEIMLSYSALSGVGGEVFCDDEFYFDFATDGTGDRTTDDDDA